MNLEPIGLANSYLYDKLTGDGAYGCDTRQAINSSIRLGPSFQTKLTLCKNSFRWRGAAWYEALPQDIRGEPKIGKFKKFFASPPPMHIFYSKLANNHPRNFHNNHPRN